MVGLMDAGRIEDEDEQEDEDEVPRWSGDTGAVRLVDLAVFVEYWECLSNHPTYPAPSKVC